MMKCKYWVVDYGLVNSTVDNLTASIDEQSGIITGPAIYSDITKPPETKHLITCASIIGFQVLFLLEYPTLVKYEALEHHQNRSIGWDLVVTKSRHGLTGLA